MTKSEIFNSLPDSPEQAGRSAIIEKMQKHEEDNQLLIQHAAELVAEQLKVTFEQNLALFTEKLIEPAQVITLLSEQLKADAKAWRTLLDEQTEQLKTQEKAMKALKKQVQDSAKSSRRLAVWSLLVMVALSVISVWSLLR